MMIAGRSDDPLEIDNVQLVVEPTYVRITSPTNGQTFIAGTPIILKAVGAPLDIHFLDFAANDMVNDSADDAPFIRTNRLLAGSYAITAIAHADSGNITSHKSGNHHSAAAKCLPFASLPSATIWLRPPFWWVTTWFTPQSRA